MLVLLKMILLVLPGASLVLLVPLVLLDAWTERRAKAAAGLAKAPAPAVVPVTAQAVQLAAQLPAAGALAAVPADPAAVPAAAIAQAPQPAAGLAGRRTLSSSRLRPVSLRTRSNSSNTPVPNAHA
jgi:hypothetical protein